MNSQMKRWQQLWLVSLFTLLTSVRTAAQVEWALADASGIT